MSAEFKGIIGIILSVIALFSMVLIEILRLGKTLFTVAIVPLIISLIAIYLGAIARKDGAKILGVISITVGIIGAVSRVLFIIVSGR
ncbi:MAG: hypothetical protein NTV72_01930 [Candidatus Taylorbacteria bacterium]|nr:hypothetical protein [Candidatus Taylorbacteria bacterium]